MNFEPVRLQHHDNGAIHPLPEIYMLRMGTAFVQAESRWVKVAPPANEILFKGAAYADRDYAVRVDTWELASFPKDTKVRPIAAFLDLRPLTNDEVQEGLQK